MNRYPEGRRERRRTWIDRLLLAACGLAGFVAIELVIARL